MPNLISMAAAGLPVARRPKPAILLPFDIREAMTVGEFCSRAGLSEPWARAVVNEQLLARKIGGRWRVSRVLAAMYLDGNKEAMRRYRAGDRAGPLVAPYFLRLGIDPMPLGQGM